MGRNPWLQSAKEEFKLIFKKFFIFLKKKLQSAKEEFKLHL